MKTFTTLVNLGVQLSNNSTTQNQTLLGQLISDQHRYLIQKYFDNENVYSTLTVAGTTLATTATLASGATSATLTATWTSPTVQQLVVFSNSQQRLVTFRQGSTAITWQPALTATATTAITTLGVQAYPIPPNISKIKNNTITVGQLQFTPAPVRAIQEWTMINSMPYSSNIPNYYYIYNNTVSFWPTPSTSGLVITFNHKSRVPDLSFADFATGSLSGITTGSNAITGVGTTWNTVGNFPLNTDLTFFNLGLKITPPSGEGIWYPILRFLSDTSLLLAMPIQNAFSATTSTYIIGQLPLLEEDFHDMLVYGAMEVYYSSIVNNDSNYKKFKTLYDERLTLLDDYAGTKSVNVDLGPQIVSMNPNLFGSSFNT